MPASLFRPLHTWKNTGARWRGRTNGAAGGEGGRRGHDGDRDGGKGRQGGPRSADRALRNADAAVGLDLVGTEFARMAMIAHGDERIGRAAAQEQQARDPPPAFHALTAFLLLPLIGTTGAGGGSW